MIRAVLMLISSLLLPLSTAAAPTVFGAKSGPGDEFLPVDQAFELQPVEWQQGQARVSWRIAPGYYLYRDRLEFAVLAPARMRMGTPVLPPGEPYKDEIFGQVQVYRDTVAVHLPLQPADAGRLRIVYQGCADAGLCYPPQTRTLDLAAP